MNHPHALPSSPAARPSLRWLALLFSLTAGLLSGCREGEVVEYQVPDALALLAEGDGGFAATAGPWKLDLPADHGAHPGFRSELWSVAGNLGAEDGRRFGFRLLFLRLALSPTPPERLSAWASNQVYLADFALTNEADARFRTAERVSRAALGLAGSTSAPARVWVEDWSLTADRKRGLELSAGADGVSLSLALSPLKTPLRQGDAQLPGLDRQAPLRLYAISRLAASGELTLAGETLAVRGSAWLDRAWGEVPLPRGQVALDRFALQLEDGRDLLCLRLRRRDGSGTPIPSCVLIAADGTAQPLRRREVTLEPAEDWASPVDGAVYPVSWRLAVPARRLELSLSPLVEAQERTGPLRAWSGAIRVEGRGRDGPVGGSGFMELTGYAGAIDG
jgi:predicted secreted hydrolase